MQQIAPQAGRTNLELGLWRYRDKDQEVDSVLAHGRRTWSVEVKSAATVTPADGGGLRRIAEQCGRDWQGGMLFYAGSSFVPFGAAGCLAVPLSNLWEQDPKTFGKRQPCCWAKVLSKFRLCRRRLRRASTDPLEEPK